MSRDGSNAGAKAAWIFGFALLSAAYFYATVRMSATRYLWMDEILSVTAAGQPSWEGVWKVVWAGADVSPPGYHYLLHGMAQVTGVWDSRLLWRFPSILAIYGAGLCTLAIARRYVSPFVALAVFGFVLSSHLFHYAIQVRPYALLAFAFAAALLLWDRYAETRRPGLSALAIWFLAAFCLSLHFYGFVVPAALGLAEVLWLISRKQFRREIWIALAATIPVELLWWPLAQHLATFVTDESKARAYFGQPSPVLFKEAAYNVVLDGKSGHWLLLTVIVVAGVLSVSRWLFPKRVVEEVRQEPYRLPIMSPLVIMIGVTTPIPILVFAFSYYVTGSFSERFMLCACIGYALAIGYIVELLPFRREVALALAVVMSVLLAQGLPDERPLSARLDVLPASLPVVVEDGRDYLELNEVVDDQTRKSLFFLFNPPSFRSPDPTNENIVKRMVPFLPANQTGDRSSFLQAHPDFYVLFSREQPMSAYAPWFFAGKWTRTLEREEDDVSLYRVSAR